MGTRTVAGGRVHWAAETFPSARGAGSGANTLPTPPGAGVPLVSTGAALGNYAWECLSADTTGAYVISLAGGVLLRNADTTGGVVAYTLPAANSVAKGAQVTTFLAASTGASAMTVAPTGADTLMNADTGVYANSAWTTAPSGNQQGRGVTWVSDGVSKWAAH